VTILHKQPAMTSTALNKRGFTLIEMLAVILVMALVIAAALPAINAVSASSLTQGARQLSNAMMLARQYAINNRQVVRLALAVDLSVTNAISSSAGSTVASNMVCRGFAVYWQSNDVNNNVVAWWPLQDWRPLPAGVVIYENNTTSYSPGTAPPATSPGPPLVGGQTTAFTTWPNARYPNTVTNMVVATNSVYIATNPVSSYTTLLINSFVEFRPTGNANLITSSSGVADIMLVQGSLYDASTHRLTINNVNNWAAIEYDGLMGRIRTRWPESY
jgi:prepilin-type N-terminal cleavage/methylation domain-containing protein